MARALAPLAVVSGKGLLRSFGLAKIAMLAKGVLDLRAYNTSGRADNETWEGRVRFLRSWFEQYFAAAGEGVEEFWDLYIDRVVTVLARQTPEGNQSEEAAYDPDAPTADDNA